MQEEPVVTEMSRQELTGETGAIAPQQVIATRLTHRADATVGNTINGADDQLIVARTTHNTFQIEECVSNRSAVAKSRFEVGYDANSQAGEIDRVKSAATIVDVSPAVSVLGTV